jgi:TRAP-type C4-dicarboxylate transport system permease small subunit
VLALLVITPIAEIILRKFTDLAITGSSAFVQHFTLLVGVLGGAIAAREGRLLSLSTLPNAFPGWWKPAAIIFSSAVAAAISGVLCPAAWKFVQSEPAEKILAYGIPYRAFQLLLPAGYALVALRLCWAASDRWHGRLITVSAAGALMWLGIQSPIDPTKLIWPAMIALAVATVLGAPLCAGRGRARLSPRPERQAGCPP